MYRIAICDDDKNMRELLRSYCSEILARDNIKCRFSEFSSAEDFDAEAKKDDFDLLLLDIEMEGKNGMTLAKELRKNGSRISIIFISGHDSYLKEGYSVQPIQYLFKPVKKVRYISEFDRRGITLKDGIKIPVGRKFYSGVRSAFIRYINM